MSTNLSWFDRNIIPLTKAYRDFVKAKESTTPERWNQDGERKFTDQQKKFLQIYKSKSGMKQTAVVPVTEAPVIPIAEKKVETIKNPEPENQITTSEEKDIIAKITRYDLFGKILEEKEYTSAESYVKALESQVDVINFKHETFLRNPELLKKVDDLLLRAKNTNSLEHYIEMVKNEMAAVPAYENSTTDKEIVGQLYFFDHEGGIAEVIKYTSSESYLKAVEKELDSNINAFKFDTVARDPKLLKDIDDLVYGIYGEENPNSLEHYADRVKNENILEKYERIAGSFPSASKDIINNISSERLLELKSLKEYNVSDEMRADNFSTIKLLREDIDKINEVLLERNNKESVSFKEAPIIESQEDLQQLQYHKEQLKYLGFGEDDKLYDDLKAGIVSHEKNFEIHTVSKTQLGNTVNFAVKYARLDQGEIFLNSYDAHLINSKGENLSQNFKVTKENSFSAREAVNLLEGRAVKIEYTNPITDLREQAFVKLNLSEDKNQSGNYNFQTFQQNYGVNTRQIVEKSNLIFDRPELKNSVIKSFEKGDIVNVKINIEDKTIEAKAVLNPQYKTVNLYDSDMNRINTNKALQGLENTNVHEKSNVREQSMSRGI